VTPRALGFHPQPPVRWFSPGVLAVAGLRVTLTSAFGSFLDKRELQARLGCQVDHRFAHRSELWLDYVADTGDGFDATYTVASLMARRQLHVDGCDDDLPRGQVLVLGGDQTYPVATAEDYTNRLEGPFRAALPWTVGDHPSLYALPGNHDWYDGLTGFLRQFAQRRWVGGWRTHQRRSYFALQLPHRWWLWGMDIQADHYIDEPQREFFTRVLELYAQRGDRLVLATARPTWIDSQRHPEMYRNLAFVERHLLEPAGVELKLALAGNLHHYNRYGRLSDDGPAHLVTSGGGGAFLCATHDLPERLHVPGDARAATRAATGEHVPAGVPPPRPYELATCYPGRTRSRAMALTALSLPFRNRGICWVVGLAHVGLLWTNQFGIRSLDPTPRTTPTFASSAEGSGWRDLSLGLIRNSASALVLVALTVGLIALAQPPVWARRRWQEWTSRVVLGLVHASAQVIAVVGVSLLAIRLASWFDAAAFVVATSVLDAVIGGIVGSVVLGAYFALGSTLPWLHIHSNEAFAASRLTSYKNFLRLHIDEHGTLTLYAVGIDRATHHWQADADEDGGSDPERSWLAPATPPAPATPHLVDRITVA
jgi:hypothetical protein